MTKDAYERSLKQSRGSMLLRAVTALAVTVALAAVFPTRLASAQTPVPPNPTVPYVVTQQGANGGNGSTGNNGGGGSSPSSDINLVFPSNFQAISTDPVATVLLKNIGGNGGAGGDSSQLENANGGGGGNGAASTGITALFDQSKASNPPILIGNNGAGLALKILSLGGNGGGGGAPGNYGQAGGSGAGGAAGDINLTFNAPPAGSFAAGISSGIGNLGISLLSIGGNSGNVSNQASRSSLSNMTGTTAANAANGGTINAAINAYVDFGISAASLGGNAGNGGAGDSDFESGTGGNGGVGGNGGDINLALTGGRVRAFGALTTGTGPASLFDAFDDPTQTVSVNTSLVTAAISALSQGGLGGNGGNGSGLISGHAGSGGVAGAGGDVSIALTGGNIQTQNYGAIGVAALSVGGAGGDGAQASSLFRSTGGNGAPGGNGGIVSVNLGQTGSAYQTLTTTGDQSDGVVALSVGGGGGYGGDVSGGGVGFSASLGGHGANGGNGGQVIVDNGYWVTPTDGSAPYLVPGYVVSTTGNGSRGIGAASVGGGGGRGGSAFNGTLGLLSLSIGGVGGQGGDGGLVTSQNLGILQTAGNQSPGIDAMSIGGGGGDGGAAMSLVVGKQFTASAAVGGQGGTGGDGGAVNAYNLHQILTFGSDSYGIRAQSVGGGGGNGGAAVAEALQDVATDDIPSITLTAAIGGKGGNGGTSGPVSVLNAGLLGTSGDGSNGILAQSVGGGGGTGGDSSALQTAYDTAVINVSVALGGKGGKGGNADAVTVYNSGLLYTLGNIASGIQAQSIGGGGGNGGYGVINSGGFNSPNGLSVQTSVAIGGSGGAAGDGGNVTVYNYATPALLPPNAINAPPGVTPNIYGAGGILTSGNYSDGIFAQSVGGGGGNAGNALANGSGGNISVNVAIGGNGGGGGNGGTVTVDNGAGAILTKGANAAGIFAQSVGGGGGTGGSAATGSGADPQYALAQYVGTNMAQALGLDPSQTVTNVANNIWDWKDNVQGAYNTLTRLQQIQSGYDAANSGLVVPAESKPSASDFTVDIGGGRAGNGGVGGSGGAIVVNSAGSIETDGPMSAAIFAQSVGGGGGDGGAANPSTGNDKIASTTVSGSIAIGGDGGSSGGGGTINITNTGALTTLADLSPAIIAESIGGGGGIGGATAAAGGVGSLKVSIGSVNGAWGAGNTVNITTSGAINTTGDSSYGLLAQSIGGGGGLATVMGAEYNTITGGATSVLHAPGAMSSVDPSFASGSGSNSDGGPVTVTASGGSITTKGTNASAVLAQSIGGGGGIIATDTTLNLSAANVFSTTGGGSGNGGTVTVNQNSGATILTSGDGAAGILAQSLGAGGIIQGLDGVNLANPVEVVNASGRTGNEVDIQSNSTITTTGAYAPGIFAQSAGYGGVVGQSDGSGFIFTGKEWGNCGNNGCPGVLVSLQTGSRVSVSGAHSYGVVLLAGGNLYGQNDTSLIVREGAQIVASGNAAGAVFLGGSDINDVLVTGTGSLIDGSQTASGLAVGSWSTNPAEGSVATLFGGKVKGSIVLGDVSTVSNGVGSTLEPGAVIYLGPHGTLTNDGTLNVGGAGKIATTAMTGNFVQDASGVLQVDANNATGQADLLAIQGTAQLGGSVQLNTTELTSKPVTVLTATGGVTMAPGGVQSAALSMPRTLASIASGAQTADPTSYLFSYKTSIVGNAVQVQPQADFVGEAAKFGANSQAVAGGLQQVWNSGSSLNGGFNALAAIGNVQGFGSALTSIAGSAVRGVAATKQAASDRFFDNMVDCQSLKPGTDPFREDDCTWFRVVGAQTGLASNDGDPGFHQDALTYQAGGQYEFSPGWFVGGSLGFEQSWLSGGSASVTGKSGLAGLMIKHQTGPWLLTGEVDGGFGSYESNRQISVGTQTGTASASPHVVDIGTHLRAAYQMPITGSIYMEPSMTLGMLYTHMPEYSETGPTSFNLDVHSSSNVVFSASPMVELGARGDIDGSHPFRTFVDVGAAAYSNSDWRGEANLELTPGIGTFPVTAKLPSAVAKVKAGVDVYAGGGFDVRLLYSADVAPGFLSQSAIARLSYHF